MAQQEKRNRETMQKIYAAMMVGDMETVKSFVADDIVIHEAESLPYGGLYRGPSGVDRLARLIYATWDDIDSQLIEVTAGGDRAVALMHFSAKGKRTGKSFSFPIAEAWRFNKEGKAIEWRPFYFDTKKCCEVYGD